MTEILDCGHVATPTEPGSLGNGVAHTSDGKTMCYKCAADMIKADALRDNHLMAYVSLDSKRITTWDGQTLGTISDTHEANRHRTFYRAKLWDGRHWYGWGPAETGTYVSLRPYKSQ